MNFFEEQTRAKRSSRWLVAWLLLTTLAMIAGVYFVIRVLVVSPDVLSPTDDKKLWFALLIVGCCCIFMRNIVIVSLATLCFVGTFLYLLPKIPWTALWSPMFFCCLSAIIGSVVALGSIYKITQISRKGAMQIALDLGGEEVSHDSQDSLEQRLIHVTDEISIAAGITPPKVFVLNLEHGINAFAVGQDASNSIIAVTKGALQQLSRDELQALVAHEISHVVNGDASLNLRLIGVLHGILMLSAPARLMSRLLRWGWIIWALTFIYAIVFTGREPIFMIFAFALLVFLLAAIPLYLPSSIGAFFARLIKSSISREREFLADAAAVQYTRNPAGLTGALQKIAQFGSQIRHPRAETVSHMSFSMSEAPSFFSRLFATHPPIAERIARIQRDFPLSAFTGNDAPARTSDPDTELPIVSFRTPPVLPD
jgi:Zn-dependent protease with chaperone function